ncbi:Retinoblastoma-related 2 [Gossypium arboreum]|uniref:Retinoblastoma-related 2 n=1 Tax=Gossypium arboreum TaxID=29729 RepID=A0A0B0MEH4_GOSAR|nr:Retinoblastoma-related 2 [Gossypium arboreum]
MGQRTKSTQPGLPHTGKLHGHVNLAESKHNAHGHVPAKPKFSPIQKKPILRALRQSKTYKYTLEEEERGHTERKAGNCSRKAN